MQYCGRIYLDPDNNRDMYFNIGWPFRGKQAYPMYENWLQPYVPETTFKQWTDTLRKELCHAPSLLHHYLQTFLMMVTFCTSCCYILYRQITFQNNLMKFNETIAQESIHHDVRLVLIDTHPSPLQNIWKDSRGQPADRMHPTYGGAPMGINIVLRLPTEIRWPPDRVGKQPVVVPQVLGVEQGRTVSHFSSAVHPQPNIII